MARARPWLTGTVVTAALVTLLALGTWQVVRLQWKTALIAEIEARVAAEAVALPSDVALAAPAARFLRVRVAGTFDHDQEMHLQSRTRGGVAGIHLMTPLLMESGQVVLVDRGWVRDAGDPEIARPEGLVEVEGVVRQFDGPGKFTPDNDPAGNMWFFPDRAAMAAATGLDVAPAYVGAIDPAGSPAGDPPGINLRNNHLQYALTWYGLALVLLGVVGAVMIKGRTGDGGQ